MSGFPGLHSEYSELKVKMFLFCILNVLLYDVQAYHQTSCFKLMQDAIENQDLVLMEDSTVKQEESLTAGTFISSYFPETSAYEIQNVQSFIPYNILL